MAVPTVCRLYPRVWCLDPERTYPVGGRRLYLFDRTFPVDVSVLQWTFGMDHLLCEEKRPPDLPGTESVSDAAVCIEVKDDAFYDGNADGAFYGCIFRMFGGADVYRLAKTGAWHQISV